MVMRVSVLTAECSVSPRSGALTVATRRGSSIAAGYPQMIDQYNTR